MAQKTERQKLVEDLKGKGIFASAIDLAVHLKIQRDMDYKDNKEYIDKILKAGYRSKMTQNLLDDVNLAIMDNEKGDSEDETTNTTRESGEEKKES